MKFAFKRSPSPVAYCAMHIKTGTRYESRNQGGLAHFAEHLLFKGTETRSAGTVNSYIERRLYLRALRFPCLFWASQNI